MSKGDAISSEWQRRNCERKRRFRLEVHAKVHALARMNDRRAKAPQLRAYLCPVCDGWHLTKKNAKPGDI